MQQAIQIWKDVFSWVTTSFVFILESFGGWKVFLLCVLVFSAAGALIVPAFSGKISGDLTDHTGGSK